MYDNATQLIPPRVTPVIPSGRFFSLPTSTGLSPIRLYLCSAQKQVPLVPQTITQSSSNELTYK